MVLKFKCFPTPRSDVSLEGAAGFLDKHYNAENQWEETAMCVQELSKNRVQRKRFHISEGINHMHTPSTVMIFKSLVKTQ